MTRRLSSAVLAAAIPFLLFPQTPGPAPRINDGGIVIHGGVSPAVSPGSLADLYGSNLAPAPLAAPPGDSLPPALGGVQVFVNGVPAPLIYVSPSQLVFQIPYETSPGTASVTVVSNSIASAPAPLAVRQAAPSLLIYGGNRAVATNQDNTINAPGNGAAPGSFLTAYLTGSGPLDNPVPTGSAAPPAPLSRETAATAVTVGGAPATVLFAGMAPGYAGLLQVNFVMPNLPPGDFPLQIGIAGAASNSPLLAVAAPGPVSPENLAPLAGPEPRYLAFQIFEGGPDPAIPFDRTLIYTPQEKIAAMAHDIVAAIGTTGGERAKLAIVLGPIAFDHTDDEARQIIRDGFQIALAENVAVGFHIDDAMFWSRRADLAGDPANVEWTDFSGTPAVGLELDWAHPPARMCFNAPAIQAEVTRRARDVIGAEIVSQLAALKAQGREDLFAGVIAGWESHMGRDVSTHDRVGFHALANRGFGPGNPPADPGGEIASIVAEFIGRWTGGLAQAGIDPARIYTHVAFLTRAQFDAQDVPPPTTYEQLVNSLPSSQDPSVAFVPNARPGFSTYTSPGIFDQIGQELSSRGNPGWATSEGTDLLPSGPAGNSGMTMETWLARSFNHGATLVTVFGWGIGGPSARNTNPFQIIAQGAESLAAYRKFLSQ